MQKCHISGLSRHALASYSVSALDRPVPCALPPTAAHPVTQVLTLCLTLCCPLPPALVRSTSGRRNAGRRNAAVEPPGGGHGHGHGRWCKRRQEHPTPPEHPAAVDGPMQLRQLDLSRTLANSPSTADKPGCCCIGLKTGRARTRCERGSVKTKQAKPATHQTRPCCCPLWPVPRSRGLRFS